MEFFVYKNIYNFDAVKKQNKLKKQTKRRTETNKIEE